LVSEGYIDTINDKGKNRKISTDKGIAAGIVTEIRKVGVERVRVNMFDRKAQEFVVDKFCNAAAETLPIPVRDDSTLMPDLPSHPHEEQWISDQTRGGGDTATHDSNECSQNSLGYTESADFDEHSVDDEHGADANTLPPPPIDPVKPPRTILSIIADALKSLGKIFSGGR